MILLEIVDVEVSQEFDVDEGALTVFDIGALVELGDGPANLEFLDFVLFDQNGFEIGGNAFAGFGNGVVELVLTDFNPARLCSVIGIRTSSIVSIWGTL
jgi:hypothetical protein